MRSKAGSVDCDTRRRSGPIKTLSRSSSSFGAVVDDGEYSSHNRHEVSYAAAFIAGLVQYQTVHLPDTLGEDDILSYLGVVDILSLRATSTQFKTWAEMSLARRTNLSIDGFENFGEGAFVMMMNLCPSLSSLTIVHCHNFELTQKKVVGNLKTLMVHNCEKLLEPEAMTILLCGCRSLTSINSSLLCDQSLETLSEHCGQSLVSLNCKGSKNVTGTGIVALASSCPKLSDLNISETSFTDEHFAALSAVKSVRTRLTKLDVSDCVGPEGEIGLSEDSVAEFIPKFLALREFSCHGVSPKGRLFDALATSVGFESLDSAGNERRRLVSAPYTVLRFGDCPLLTATTGAESLRSLAKACSATLKVLEISRSKDLSDLNALCAVVESCPNLEEVSLRGCEGVTNIFLQVLGESCPNLRKLFLSRCTQISDGGIAALTTNCQHLQVADFSGCRLLTDRSIGYFGQSCPDLEVLVLFCCSSITDEGFKSAVKNGGFQKLKTLDISWCFRVEAASLVALAENCLDLEVLRLEGLDHLCSTELTRMRSYRPGLKIETCTDDSYDLETKLWSPVSGKDRRSSSVSSGGSSVPESNSPTFRQKLKKRNSSKVILIQPVGLSSPRSGRLERGRSLENVMGEERPELGRMNSAPDLFQPGPTSPTSRRKSAFDQEFLDDSPHKRWGENPQDLDRLNAFAKACIS